MIGIASLMGAQSRLILCMSMLACLVSLARGEEQKSPTFSEWRGFTPGDYVVEKRTYRGVGSLKDGVQYRKKVLWGATKYGAPSFFDYTSDNPDGPWTIGAGGSVSDAEPDAQRESHELAPAEISVADRVFHCRVVRTLITDDSGKRTRTQWIDKESGLDVKREEVYEGQERSGRPSRWALTRVTSGIETVTVGKEQLTCLVQDQEQVLESGKLKWHELVAAKVPGHVVASKYWEPPQEAPKVETTLLAWGHDPGLLEEYKQAMPKLNIVSEEDIEHKRKAEEENRRQEVFEHHRRTLADLKSPDPAKRDAAVNRLARRPRDMDTDLAGIEGVKNALDDPAPEVRRRAAWGVGQLGVKGMTKKILELLQRDPEGAGDYLAGLGLQADPEGLPAVIQYASSAQQGHRLKAVAALENFKTEEARSTLEKALGDPEHGVRLRAVESLEKAGNTGSVPALLAVVRDSDPMVGKYALRVIPKLGDDSAVPALLELLKSLDEEARAGLCASLGRMKLKDPRPVGDALLKLLDEPSPKVRMGVIVGLGELHESRAVPKLIEMTRSTDQPAESQAMSIAVSALALGKIGGPEATKVLSDMLDVPQRHRLACTAFEAMGAPGAKPLLSHLSRAHSSESRREELDVLGRIGTRDTISDLQQYLSTCPPPDKRAAREAIRRINERLAGEGTTRPAAAAPNKSS